MFNKQRGVTTTEKESESKTEIIIDSDKYNADKAYSESINETLTDLFINIGDSYKCFE